MTRQPIYLAAALALALAAAPAAADAAVTASPSSAQRGGIAITSAAASANGRTVAVGMKWDAALLAKAGKGDRFTITVKAFRFRDTSTLLTRRLSVNVASVDETVKLRLSPAQARSLRSAYRVIVTATQQYDSVNDKDTAFEISDVAVRHLRGTRNLAAGRLCRAVLRSGVNASRCDLRAVDLYKSDLRKVNLAYANLGGARLDKADLSTTDLTGTHLNGALLKGAKFAAGEQSAFTLPQDGQTAIIDAIDSAKQSVDVIIYDFGGPNLVGQAGKPGALMRAVSRGVNVRVILNSGQNDGLCTGVDVTAQAICAWNPKLDPLYATQASLASAAQTAGAGAGKYRVQFSSQNFQITHQKTVLIDTANSDGTARSTAQLLPTSQVLVSTGNLQAYPVDWGRRSGTVKNTTTGKYVPGVLNANYLTDPAATCPTTGCGVEWAARDFGIKVTDPALMERISSVFTSDQACDGRSDTNNLLASSLADSWANGTLLTAGSLYPDSTSAESIYEVASNAGQLDANPQGNARERMRYLITHATKSLLVYNEEFNDPEITGTVTVSSAGVPLVTQSGLLAQAAKRGVDVHVVMAGSVPADSFYGSNGNLAEYNDLVANGGQVTLLPADSPGSVYVHAKAIIADGIDGFMGSENFGFASINWNRELGLMLTSRQDPSKAPIPSLLSVTGIAQIISAFWIDYTNVNAVAWPSAGQTYVPPKYPPKAFPDSFPMNCLPYTNSDRYQPALPTRDATQPSGRPDAPAPPA
ncbi:MAG: phospholipase D-like domain-containing protein [Actinomycetota bacterium]